MQRATPITAECPHCRRAAILVTECGSVKRGDTVVEMQARHLIECPRHPTLRTNRHATPDAARAEWQRLVAAVQHIRQVATA